MHSSHEMEVHSLPKYCASVSVFSNAFQFEALTFEISESLKSTEKGTETSTEASSDGGIFAIQQGE